MQYHYLLRFSKALLGDYLDCFCFVYLYKLKVVFLPRELNHMMFYHTFFITRSYEFTINNGKQL